MKKTIIEISGGTLQSIKSTDPEMVFEVIDYDNDPEGDIDIITYPRTAMSEDQGLPDFIAEIWNIEDVIAQAEQDGVEITKEQARVILRNMERDHDASYGINWDMISNEITEYLDNQVENG